MDEGATLVVWRARKGWMRMSVDRQNLLNSFLSILPQRDLSVFVHGAAATPNDALFALADWSNATGNAVQLVHLHTVGEHPGQCLPQYPKLRVKNLFLGANLRAHLDFDRCDAVSCFLSEIPDLFRSKTVPIDVALVQTSPVDRHGNISLGIGVDIALAALQSADLRIGLCNNYMPRVFGDGVFSQAWFHSFFEYNVPLPESEPEPPSELEKIIGQQVARWVPDGAVLQVGIGAIPNASCLALRNHKNLGIHTELWSDGLLDLVERGVVTNSTKHFHQGKIVSSFSFGSARLYEFMNDNPAVLHLGIDYVNDPRIISRNDQVIAINSAVEIDLTGQVCADSIGSRIISGFGGQVDFMRGAALSKGGRPIVAISSRTKKGRTRIVSRLAPGAGVVTTRAHVHVVATEYGSIDLHGMGAGQRVRALIDLAHPDDREQLAREWHEQLG